MLRYDRKADFQISVHQGYPRTNGGLLPAALQDARGPRRDDLVPVLGLAEAADVRLGAAGVLDGRAQALTRALRNVVEALGRGKAGGGEGGEGSGVLHLECGVFFLGSGLQRK